MVGSLLSSVLRLVSLAACLIAFFWFAAFVVEQTSKASAHQQAELNGTAPSEPSSTSGEKKSQARRTLDSAFEAISAPYAGVVSTESQWAAHILDVLLTLLVYGVVLGYVRRLVRLA